MYDQGRKPSYGGQGGGASSFGGGGGQQRAGGYGGGGSNNAAAAGGGGGASGRAAIPLRPVTIRMVLDAQRVGEGAMNISGHEVGVVSIAGRIVEAPTAPDTSSTGNSAKSHTYRVSDGTGLITVKHWLDASAQFEQQTVGSFIVATGTVKLFQEKPVLSGTIRLIPDQNELTYHLLDCINVHLRMMNGDRMPAGGKSKDASSPSNRAPAPYQQQQQSAYGQPQQPNFDAGANVEKEVHRVMLTARGQHNQALTAQEVLHAVRNLGATHATIQQVEQILRHNVDAGTLNFDGHRWSM